MCFLLVSDKNVSQGGAQHSQACGRRPAKLADLSKVTVLVGSRLEQKVRTWKPESLCQGLFLGNTPVT